MILNIANKLGHQCPMVIAGQDMCLGCTMFSVSCNFNVYYHGQLDHAMSHICLLYLDQDDIIGVFFVTPESLRSQKFVVSAIVRSRNMCKHLDEHWGSLCCLNLKKNIKYHIPSINQMYFRV